MRRQVSRLRPGGGLGVTVAGTAPDFNRLPYSPPAMTGGTFAERGVGAAARRRKRLCAGAVLAMRLRLARLVGNQSPLLKARYT